MRAVWLAIPVVAAQIVTHAAQSQPASTQAASTAAAAEPSQTVMVSGCVRNDPAGAPSATSVGSTAGAASSTGRFVLVDAAVNAATTDAAPITSYVIHGRTDELAKHVGHLVEITGTASEEPPAARTDGVATAAPAGLPEQQVVPHEPHRGPVGTVAAPDEAARSTHSSVRHLTVQSVRTIAASCP
jgi:hypothetical protein